MKIVKQLLSSLLVLVLIFTSVPMVHAAESNSDNEPIIGLESKYAAAGESVQVDVVIQNNPGILGGVLEITFDSSLTLLSASNGEAFSDLAMTKPGKFSSPCRFAWDAQETSVDKAKDGVILSLTFDVDSEAGAGKDLEISLKALDFYLHDLSSIKPKTENGFVKVISYTPGDLDGDGKIIVTDVILTRRLIVGGYDINVNELAADVNGDGKLTALDTIYLRRYVAGGYNIELSPSPSTCIHDLQATAYCAPSCTENGNIAFWHCEKCDKFFDDEDGIHEVSDITIPATGHMEEIIPEVKPTLDKDGTTEGIRCSICQTVLVEPQPWKLNTYTISYDLTNGDDYLNEIGVSNPYNPTTLKEGESIYLEPITDVNGYRFLGWYDGAGDNANSVTQISNIDHNIYLYAHWEAIDYNVYFKYDKELASLIDKNCLENVKYQINSSKTLPILALPGYTFLGWSDDSGNLIDQIPRGTTGEKTYYANWISNRNKAYSKKKLNGPLLTYYDDNLKMIVVAYEIGKIENIPLKVIEDFGGHIFGGIASSEERTYNTSTDASIVNTYAKTVQKATTDYANWTLADSWTSSTSVDKEWCEQNNTTVEKAEQVSKSNTGNWYVSNSSGGSSSTNVVDSTDSHILLTKTGNTKTYDTTDKTTYDTDERVSGFTVNGGYSSGGSAEIGVGPVKAAASKNGFNIGGSYEDKTTTKTGTETTDKTGSETEQGGSGSIGADFNHTTNTSNTSSWNTESGYSSSVTASQSSSLTEMLSRTLSESTHTGETYIKANESTSAHGLSSTDTNTDEYGTAITYSTHKGEEYKITYSNENTMTGYHRLVLAGSAKVFGIVGYDIATKSYFTYTLSIMEDETHTFEDYSYRTASFDDNQVSVIKFEIPDDIRKTVHDQTFITEGVEVDSEGYVTSYNGNDSLVVIPNYTAVSNLDGTNKAIKVVGIRPGAFQNNSTITGVLLNEYISEIPENAFRNCSRLCQIYGRNVSSIGKNAFDGCSTLRSFSINSAISVIGEGAFNGLDFIDVDAATASIVHEAISSGAKNVVVGLKNIADSEENSSVGSLNNSKLEIPETIDSFVLRGYDKEFNDLEIVSDARKQTIINRLTINSSSKIPFTTTSENVSLCQTTFNSSGIASVLKAPYTEVGLYGTVNMKSDGTNAFLCKSVNMSQLESGLATKLNVDGNVVSCGTITDNGYLNINNGEIITVDESRWNNILTSYTLSFDANGGECSIQSRTVNNSEAIGELPVPTRYGYNFTGWYLSDNTLVDKDTVFSSGDDVVLYAHWSPIEFTVTFDANDGIVDETSRILKYEESIGNLPTATRDYYDFVGWFTDKEGGTQITSDYKFLQPQDVTLYAHWNQHPVSDWVTANNVPSGAQIVNRKWTYTRTTYQESTATSLAGFDCYDSYWVESGRGSFAYTREFPSGYSKDDWYYQNINRDPYSAYENQTNKRTVNCRWNNDYIYWHWMYDTNYANGVSNRAIYDRYGVGPTNNYLYKYFGAFESQTDYTGGDNGYCNNLNIRNYIVPDRTSWDQCQGATRWFRFKYYICDYVDYYKVFKYVKVENNLETTNDPSGESGVSNVVEYVQYRAK